MSNFHFYGSFGSFGSFSMSSSVIAGILAACASIVGKLGSENEPHIISSITLSCHIISSNPSPMLCSMMEFIFRSGCFILMLICNSIMLKYFVRGLHETDSLTATVISSATNFMLSGVSGMIIFQERLPLQWLLGAITILLGICSLLYAEYGHDTKEEDTNKKKQM